MMDMIGNVCPWLLKQNELLIYVRAKGELCTSFVQHKHRTPQLKSYYVIFLYPSMIPAFTVSLWNQR